MQLHSWRQPPEWRERSRNYWARTFEAEDTDLFTYPIGREVTDDDRVTRHAEAGVHDPGLLLDSRRSIYLRRNDTARFGHHYFWLKTDDVSGTDHIATIRVIQPDGTSDGRVVAYVDVSEEDFMAANTYQDFGLEYTVDGAPGNFPVRYQVHWTGSGNLWVDHIRAHDWEISDPDTGVLEDPPHGAAVPERV